MDMQVYINLLHHDGTITDEYEFHRRVRDENLGAIVAAAMAKAKAEFPAVDGVEIALDLTITEYKEN